ncbi:MAG: AAA family ATPase, partial [Cystobacter sp.]
MKILTIRGRNLTSLAGDFALELDQPPLDKLGLFAITGATGAGKSTLLDAMCLALFDCTPRLEQGGGVLVGRSGEDEKARLKDNDARGVLRRGALEGLAEVEFLGKDGRRYKANWSVRRAHNRQDGRIMEPVMSLADVASGQLFGAKKGEVLKAIEEKLGLSFEQFRRSALLAQGEFAAFLRAKEKERAELLERMTGTEVYSRLSIAAHKRNKQVEAELEKQAQGLEAVKLLSEEERQQEAGALVREQSELTQAREVQARAEDAVRWYQTRASHLAREREADTERERAEQALLAAAPRRLDWERVSAAEALRAPMSAVDEATAALAARDTEWAARRAEEAAARETERAGEAERGEAERRRDAAVAAEEAARPELDAAEALDGELKHLEELAREAAREHEKARDGEQRARTALAVLLEKEGAARKRVEDIQAWRDKRGPVEPVAREWSRWETELKRYKQQARQEAESQGLLERTRARTESLHGEVLRLDETRRQATEAMRLAEAETVRLASERGVEADAERRLRREALSTRHELLKELEATRQEVVDTARAEREASREVEEARSEQTQATAEAEAARVRRIGLDASLKEARRAFEQARDAQGLTALRAELREGEPCPLCGATEHPHARAELALEKLVEEGRGRVTSLEAELEQVARGESAATVRAQGAGQRAVQAGERAEAATKRMATRSERWLRSREALVGTRPPEAVESPEAETWLAEALTQTRTQAELLRAEEARAEARAREVEAARVRKEAARTDAEAAEQAWRGVDEAWRKNVEAASQCQRDVEQARGVREELLTALSVAFKEWKNWEPALAKDVPAFQERCAKAVREWNEQEGALRQAEADARSEADQRGPAQATAELLQAQTGVCARTVAERNEALVRARAARGQLWAGRATVEVRAAL